MGADGLHFSAIAIENFRGIDSLNIPELGRVTMLTGRNSVGKTTVLDAIRVLATRGDPNVLIDLLDEREEVIGGFDADGDKFAYPNLESLFFENGSAEHKEIQILTDGECPNLSMSLVQPTDEDDPVFLPSSDEAVKLISQSAGNLNRTLTPVPSSFTPSAAFRRRLFRYAVTTKSRSTAASWPNPIPCRSLGPAVLGNSEVDRLWNNVALTEDEELAVEALNLVTNLNVERLSVIGGIRSNASEMRRAVVTLHGHNYPVPLRRLGDGATRLFGFALALANSRNGLLLIDEAENGIHHSIQENLWRMVLRVAEKSNVQIVATTHSSDGVHGFARAAVESPSEGVLYRIQHVNGQLEAVKYNETDLQVAAEQTIEVR